MANRVDGGKRPRSSMSPTIGCRMASPAMRWPHRRRDDHSFSSRAPSSRLSIGRWTCIRAISMPHMVNMFGDYVLEEREQRHEETAAMLDMSCEFSIAVRPLTSGLQGISIHPRRARGRRRSAPRRRGARGLIRSATERRIRRLPLDPKAIPCEPQGQLSVNIGSRPRSPLPPCVLVALFLAFSVAAPLVARPKAL